MERTVATAVLLATHAFDYCFPVSDGRGKLLYQQARTCACTCILCIALGEELVGTVNSQCQHGLGLQVLFTMKEVGYMDTQVST